MTKPTLWQPLISLLELKPVLSLWLRELMLRMEALTTAFTTVKMFVWPQMETSWTNLCISLHARFLPMLSLGSLETKKFVWSTRRCTLLYGKFILLLVTLRKNLDKSSELMSLSSSNTQRLSSTSSVTKSLTPTCTAMNSKCLHYALEPRAKLKSLLTKTRELKWEKIFTNQYPTRTSGWLSYQRIPPLTE